MVSDLQAPGNGSPAPYFLLPAFPIPRLENAEFWAAKVHLNSMFYSFHCKCLTHVGGDEQSSNTGYTVLE